MIQLYYSRQGYYFFLNFRSDGKILIGPAFFKKSCCKKTRFVRICPQLVYFSNNKLTSKSSEAVARDLTSTHRQTAR